MVGHFWCIRAGVNTVLCVRAGKNNLLRWDRNPFSPQVVF